MINSTRCKNCGKNYERNVEDVTNDDFCSISCLASLIKSKIQNM